MIYRSTGNNTGCIVLLVILAMMLVLFRYIFVLLLKTPLGLIILLYILYRYIRRWYIGRRYNGPTRDSSEDLGPEIEVDYQAYDVDYEEYKDE